MAAKRKLTPWLWGVGGATFLAGLLFGYDRIQERWVVKGDGMLDGEPA
jgi:hypothetical protein